MCVCEKLSRIWCRARPVVSEIRRLSKITKDLNTFGKPSPPVLLSHQPEDLIVGLKRLIHTEALANQVKVTTRCADCPGTIQVDAQQVQQVILNLVVNAFEAMPQGGELLLEVRPDLFQQNSPRMFFSVTDTGCGIPEEHLETIFDPFFTTKTQGTGFGLALANTTVTQNEGEITVASVLGEGSTFTLSFPLFRHGDGRNAAQAPREKDAAFL